MLVVPDKKALIINSSNPEQLLAVIPTARSITVKGKTLVVVPHRLDESKVLRNLGLVTPSPIRYHYDWSGQYQPFKAQMDTAEFLSMHPRAYVLSEIGCVDSATEYLSPTGWLPISEYNGGQVAQYDPETKGIEFVAPLEYVKKPCPTMLKIKTKYGLDQMLSPEHRVLLQDRQFSRTEVVTAQELKHRHDAWLAGERYGRSASRVAYSRASIPVTFTAPSRAGLPLTDAQIRLQVAVIADAHFPNGTTRCTIRLKKQRKVVRLRRLLEEAGVAFKERVSTAPTAPGFVVFSFNAPTRDKVFEASWWDATPAQLAVIADEVMHWDGSTSARKPTQHFSTLQRASADFVQYVFASQGRVARVLSYPRRGKVEYDVTVRQDPGPLMLVSKGKNGYRQVMDWAPSTDGYKYCFMVPSTFLLFRRNGCIFASGNTGKTMASLWAFDYLRSIGKRRRLLVVCPLSTMERTWADELMMHFPHLDYVVLYGTGDRRRKLLAQDADVYIVNHDGLRIIELELAARDDIDLIIVDELAQAARNSRTHRWVTLDKVVNKQARGQRWCWGVTGTPTPNAPTDAWAQCRLVTPSSVPLYFGRFRDLVMKQVNQFLWVPREEASEQVHKAMQPAIRFSRAECLDLPPCVFQGRVVELTNKQRMAYKEMFERLRAGVDGEEVLAVNEGVKAGKLLQICCGVAYDRQGDEVTTDATPRLEAVKEIIEEADGKTIVYVPFVSTVRYVADYLRGEGYTVECIYGDVKKAERDRIFGAFQNATEPKVLVAQPAAMSHGLTLTAANTIVWYAPIFSNDIYDQACGRITRPSQTRAQLIVNIEGSEIERRMYDRLRRKQKMQGILLSMIEEERIETVN